MNPAKRPYKLSVKFCRIGLIISVFSLISGAAHSQDRLALVIGNSNYNHAPLKNPSHDAQDMAATLERFGFAVTQLVDADQRGMEQAIRQFSRTLDADTVGLFYFAGHGVQVRGENYLVPIGADVESEVDVRYEAVALGRVLDGMNESGGGLNLVILDACRNNPYQSSFRSAQRGLARATPASGTMIMYATEPGKVASDGEGRNGLFTGELIDVLSSAPQLTIEQVFKRTTRQVFRRTGGAQSPWSEGGIRGEFAFVKPAGGVSPVTPPVSEPSLGGQQTAAAKELTLWKAVEEGNSIAYYQIYLEQFPQGTFAGLAQLRIAALEDKAEQRQQAERDALRAAQEAEQAEAERQARLAAEAELEAQRLEQERLQAEQWQSQVAADQAAERSLSMSREWRRGVQVGLNAAGIPVGFADGLWGEKTRSGIRRWQESQGFAETGYLTPTQYQQIVAELGIQAVSVRKSYEPEMVRIEGGVFEQGSRSGGAADERPVRQVRVGDFEIGKYEVMFDEYDAYARAMGKELPDDEGWGRGRRPVINVSWQDAQDYIDWLNANTQGGYRLPSESEWEYAARAGSQRAYHFGDDESGLCRYGNGNSDFNKDCDDDYKNTSPVGSLIGNGNGLYDMHGNVREWVEDCWHRNYEGASVDGSAWVTGCDGDRRVLRGGSWSHGPSNLRSANRTWVRPVIRYYSVGFRLARTLTP